MGNSTDKKLFNKILKVNFLCNYWLKLTDSGQYRSQIIHSFVSTAQLSLDLRLSKVIWWKRSFFALHFLKISQLWLTSRQISTKIDFLSLSNTQLSKARIYAHLLAAETSHLMQQFYQNLHFTEFSKCNAFLKFSWPLDSQTLNKP